MSLSGEYPDRKAIIRQNLVDILPIVVFDVLPKQLIIIMDPCGYSHGRLSTTEVKTFVVSSCGAGCLAGWMVGGRGRRRSATTDYVSAAAVDRVCSRPPEEKYRWSDDALATRPQRLPRPDEGDVASWLPLPAASANDDDCGGASVVVRWFCLEPSIGRAVAAIQGSRRCLCLPASGAGC